MEKQMAIPDGRWVIALFAAIAVLLITLNTARPAPVHGINTSAIAEASLVEKSVIINPHPSPLQLLVATDAAPWHPASHMRMARLK
jgi:hypothetical protein